MAIELAVTPHRVCLHTGKPRWRPVRVNDQNANDGRRRDFAVSVLYESTLIRGILGSAQVMTIVVLAMAAQQLLRSPSKEPPHVNCSMTQAEFFDEGACLGEHDVVMRRSVSRR